jgi:small-conductance mechanosensitive channel
VKDRRAQLAREAQTWTGFSEPRPYSILLADGLRESIQVERLEVANSESALSMLAALIEENRILLNQAEEKIRQINEQLEGNRNAPTVSELTWRGEFEKLRSQVAAGAMAALDLETKIRQERLAGSRVHLGLLERQLVLANAGAIFTESDMEKVAARLEREQRQLEGELAEAESRRRPAAQALESDQEEWRRIRAQPGADPLVSARAAEQVEVRRTQLETADTAATLLRFMLEAGNVERAIWEMRFASYRSRNVEALGQTARRLEQFGRRVEIWKRYYRQQLESASSQVLLQETRLAGLGTNSDLTPLVRERLAALRERDQFLLRMVRNVERGDRLIQRLSEGLREAAGDLPFTGRLRNALSNTGTWFGRLWHLELFVAQDTINVDGQSITGKRSVTLGKILSAILILVVGYWVTGLISCVMEPIFIKRFKIDANQASLIRRWLRVVLVLSLAIFSLVSVKIPLTVFAFAGGALAIGLGFGMQTLLKNFVSGIIILFERPFRIGDVLDVAGQRGSVVGVGIRSSVLKLWDGTETLIPNSTLLENSVTNWTYSSPKVRFTISLGVAYGSDTRRVVQLLSEIAERHGLVEKEPPPQILFVDFADSSLTFELRFWLDVIRSNSAQVASDLRHMIAGTLAEHGIVMAFPQRDIHLEASRPLQIQVLPAPDGAPQAGV